MILGDFPETKKVSVETLEKIKTWLSVSLPKLGDNKQPNLVKKSLIKNISSKLINIIDEHPELVTIQDKDGYNLGMICAQYGLEKVVINCLKDADAATQQNCRSQNIGMIAAAQPVQLKKATLFALQNKEAVAQMDNQGRTIARLAYDFIEKEEVNKVLSETAYEDVLSDL
ncbi:MAG: hypothetical protein IKM43_03925 [Clostridia bacterium]|nr:hypothetical protein [Clostridia bacterium]